MKKYKKLLTKDFLIKEYIVNKKSCEQIANEIKCCCDTVWRYLIKYNIKLRTKSESLKGISKVTKYSQILTKEFLYIEYIINKKNIYQIAKKINCSQMTIYKYLKKWSILIRTKSESKKLINNYGKNAPNYIDNRTNKIYYCKERGCYNIISYKNYRAGQGRCESCAGKLHAKKQLGKNNSNWKGGVSFEPYPIEWTESLKELIRQRDNSQCQICGIKQEDYYRALDVHHIDYDKNNSNFNNLISLCKNCHGKTNGNRDYWIDYFNKCRYTRKIEVV